MVWARESKFFRRLHDGVVYNELYMGVRLGV